MRVRVRFLAACDPAIEQWVESLPGVEPERRAFARLHLAAVTELLAERRGDLPEAQPVPGWQPAVYWWEFHHGWWMRYCVEDTRRWFRSPDRVVTVLLVTDRPPG